MQQIPSEKSCLTFIVIDDHESVLNGTVEILRKSYSSAEFNTATNASYAFEQVINYQPDLLVMDLSIPEKPEMTAKVDTGIQLLKVLMENYSHLNLVVQSAHVKTLIRIRPYNGRTLMIVLEARPDGNAVMTARAGDFRKQVTLKVGRAEAVVQNQQPGVVLPVLSQLGSSFHPHFYLLPVKHWEDILSADDCRP